MSTFDSQVSKSEIIEMQIEHTHLSFIDRQSLEYGGTFTKLFMHVSS
jgi:hypothetical protein